MESKLEASGIYFIALAIFSSIMSLCALVLVMRTKKGRLNFILNLIFSSLALQFILLIIYLNPINVAEIGEDWACGAANALKRIVIGVVSLTMVGLYYERLERSTDCPEVNFSLKKVIGMTWGLTILVSTPLFIMAEKFTPEQGNPYCVKKRLFGSMTLKIIYEVAVFICLHLAPSSFIIYYLLKTKFRMKYLMVRKNFPRSLKKKLRRAQLMFWHPISFIVFWIPFGFLNGLNGILENRCITDVPTGLMDPLAGNLGLVLMAFAFLHPIIYLWIHNRRFLLNLPKICCYINKCRTDPGIEACETPFFITSSVMMNTFAELSEVKLEGDLLNLSTNV